MATSHGGLTYWAEVVWNQKKGQSMSHVEGNETVYRPDGKGDLHGKVVLISGTGGGMGRAAALLFAREGAVVVGGDLNADGAEETVQLVREEGGQMTSEHPLDFADPEAVSSWASAAEREFGGIDILYNNASATRMSGLTEMSDDDWRFGIRNELDLVFVTTRAVWPHLIRRGGGAVVNVASMIGYIAGGGVAHASAKHAIIGMTRELALAGGEHNIRVNSVSPGYIRTPATQFVTENPELEKSFLEAQIIHRAGEPEDVVRAVMFLASDRASFITGQDLLIDGGYTVK